MTAPENKDPPAQQDRDQRERAEQELDQMTADGEVGDANPESEAKIPVIGRNLDEARDRVQADHGGNEHPC